MAFHPCECWGGRGAYAQAWHGMAWVLALALMRELMVGRKMYQLGRAFEIGGKGNEIEHQTFAIAGDSAEAGFSSSVVDSTMMLSIGAAYVVGSVSQCDVRIVRLLSIQRRHGL